MSEVGHNIALSLPKEVGEATKVAWNRYQRMLAERRQIAARMRDVVQDAKAHKYPTPSVRMAHRLERMSPEKREKWAEQMAVAARLFGFNAFTMADDDARDPKLWGFVERMRALWIERRQLAKQMRELQENAVAAGVDFDGLKQISSSRAARLEPGEAREAWIAKLDALGTFLGWW